MTIHVTQFAEGLPRRRFLTVDIERMVAAGLMEEGERTELLGGELVPMASEGRRHEMIRAWLNEQFMDVPNRDYRVSIEAMLRLTDDTFVHPDFAVIPPGKLVNDLRAPDMLLIVEIAETSLGYDRGRKAALYATHGVREYWVVNALSLATIVHRNPSPTGYRAIAEMPEDATLVPTLVRHPGLALRDLE